MANQPDPLDDLLLDTSADVVLEPDVVTADPVAPPPVDEASAATSGEVGAVDGNDDVVVDLLPVDLPPPPPPPAPKPVTVTSSLAKPGEAERLNALATGGPKVVPPPAPVTFLERLDQKFAQIMAELEAIRLLSNGTAGVDADQVREIRTLLLTLRRQKDEVGALIDEAQEVVVAARKSKEAADSQFADFQRWFGNWRGH